VSKDKRKAIADPFLEENTRLEDWAAKRTQKQAVMDSPDTSMRRAVAMADATRTPTRSPEDQSIRTGLARSRLQDVKDAERVAAGQLTQSEMRAAKLDLEMPLPVDPKHVAALSHAIIHEHGFNRLDKVCSVCSCFVPPGTPVRSWSVEQMCEPRIIAKLSVHAVSPPLPKDVIAHYDCSACDERLSGLLLSSHTAAYLSSPPSLNVCDPCSQSLRSDTLRPPALSIANNNAIGMLPPSLRDASWVESTMTALVTGRCHIVMLKGGKTKALRGHVLTVEMDAQKVSERLPLAINATTFRVVIAGALTPIQKLASMKTHTVRRAKVQGLLDFYMANNPYYRYMKLNQESLDACPLDGSLIDLQGETIDEDAAADVIAPVAMGQQSDEHVELPKKVNRLYDGGYPDDHDDNEQGFSLHHVSAVSNDASDEPIVVQQPNAANLAAQSVKVDSDMLYDDVYAASARELQRLAAADVLAVRSGTRLVQEAKDILTLMFPELFPYGRGGLEEKRRVPIGLDRMLWRCLNLSSGQFGNSASFVLKSYNSLARKESANKAEIILLSLNRRLVLARLLLRCFGQ
jgi:hypothetical protein